MDLALSRDRLPPRLKRGWVLVRAIVHEFRTENITFMAGSVAYHAFVSLLPLLVLLLLALSSVGGASRSEVVFDVLEAALTSQGREIVTNALTQGSQLSGVSVLGLGILLWATLRIFRGLDQGFSAIYETEGKNSILDQVKDGVVVLGVLVLAVFGASVVHTWIPFPGGLGGDLLELSFVVVVLAVALFPMYYVFPDAAISPLGALPGTILAAVGVAALESLFRLYVAVSSTGESYGVLGGVIVLLTWLYFNSLVILLGATLNAVLTNQSEDVDVEPVIGDHRPGIGRTFGDPLHDGGDPDVIRNRLQTIEQDLDGAEWLTVTIDGSQIRLPVPEDVSLRGAESPENGDEVGIELRW